MAKPTYIIYKDQPNPDSYGQYTYNINNMLAQSGLNTLDTSDDLYSMMDIQTNVGDNFISSLEWSGEAKIQFETYPLWAGGPETNGADFILLNSTSTSYLIDGGISVDSDFTSYSSIGTFIGQIPNYFIQRSYTPSEGVVTGDDGSYMGYGARPYGWQTDTTATGYFENIGFNNQSWLSPYNLDAWDYDCCDDFPIIGFVSENQALNFLQGQEFGSWNEYLVDIQNNYSSYSELSSSKHYFYFIEDNYFYWSDINGWLGDARTRIVYRYPKTLILDSWQTGTPITSEVMAWRIYGSGDNWWDSISGNDECWNNVTHIGTGWTKSGDGLDSYITESELDNSWDEIGVENNCQGIGTWRPTLRININPPLVEIEDLPPYEPFYNMGGKTITEISEQQHQTQANPEFGGYNVYFDDLFPGLETVPFYSNLIYNDWRPISNVFIGDDYLTANYLQTYYELDSMEYLYTSAPNIVNLYFTIQDDESQSQVVNELFGQEYYQKIIDNYISIGMTENISFENLLSSNLSQKLKFFVVNWDWKEDDENFDEITFPFTDEELIALNFNDKTFIVQEAFNADGSPNVLQYQYNSPGIKLIKAFVMSTIINELNEEYVLVIKSLTIRVNINLDDIYIEDFADIGGPDFTFIPWPYTSPIISGIDSESQYLQSLESVIDNNLFSDRELLTRNFARKAVLNEELGNYLGNVDVEQTRLFLDGTFDMAKLLGIEDSYENVDAGTYYTFYPYDKFKGTGGWDGRNNKYPEETSVGSIFINDTLDLDLLSKCLFEFNFGSSDGRTIRDSSGNGNKGILIGDFKVKKEDKDIPIRRDSVMRTPENDTQNGAL